MPGENRMGPTGQGPMTGRGRGRCGGANAPNNNPVGETQGGRGRGRGQGRGLNEGGGRFGWRHWFNATGLPGWMRGRQQQAEYQAVDGESELQSLQRQAVILREQLTHIEQRLADLATPKPDDQPR